MCGDLSRARLAAGKSGSGWLSGVPTNEITIVPPLPAVLVEASWHSLHQISAFSVDELSLSLDLFQDETRTELLFIKQLALTAVDASGRSVWLDGRSSCSDLKVLMEEEEDLDGVSAMKFKAAAKRVLLDFSGPLSLAVDSSSTKSNIYGSSNATNNDKSRGPSSIHCELVTHKSTTSSPSSSSSSSFHCDELALQFRCPARPLNIVLQLELACGFDGGNLTAIQRLNCGQAVQEVCLHPVLARRLILKIQLIPRPGLQLGRVQLHDRLRPFQRTEPAVLTGLLKQRLGVSHTGVRLQEVAEEQMLVVEVGYWWVLGALIHSPFCRFCVW